MFDTSRITLLDGAMGTMLQAAGLKPGQLPETIALTDPALLTSIHRQYVEAGSRILYANTFGANRRKLQKLGLSVEKVVSAAVRCAREACQGTDAQVAVDIGPLGELLAPLGTLPFAEAVSLFAEIARAGEAAGADLAVIETMTDLYEAKAALLAVKESTRLPVLVTMTFDETGRTFTGCTVASMCATLSGLGADAIGLNCSLGPAQMLPLIREICRRTALPVILKPNAGLPDPVDGHYDLSPADFAAAVREAVLAGVSLVGGCCGTSPAYIAALRDALAGVVPGERCINIPPMVCTPTTPVEITGVRVIGERINPTGKKRFQQALLEGDLDYIVDVAIAQEDAGAQILDVNVGFPGVDEAAMLPKVVQALQEATTLPLQLDSANPAALEAALRVYNGKAAVNSVNGTPESLAKILPIVKKYGATVVGLTLDEHGLPTTAEERIAIAERILQAAQSIGIPRQDVWIDCLTLTVSAQQDQAEATLAAVRNVSHRLGLPTVLGVSNISFGLPNRWLIAQTFLVRALGEGLTLPILNPNQREMMDAVAAFRVLSGEDEQCGNYIRRFADAPTAAAPTASALTLDEAICRGLKADAARLAAAALDADPALDLVEAHLIPALDRVGEDYEHQRAFLPQLLATAQAAQAVFGVVESRMGASAPKGEPVIIATVHGDIHDIGKNIVRTVMANYGFRMIDLGRDVPVEEVVSAVQTHHAKLVGLSALMTTTLPAMAETVRALKALPDAPQVMIGGAVVTEEYRAAIGADWYVKDAKAAVEVARRVLG